MSPARFCWDNSRCPRSPAEQMCRSTSRGKHTRQWRPGRPRACSCHHPRLQMTTQTRYSSYSPSNSSADTSDHGVRSHAPSPYHIRSSQNKRTVLSKKEIYHSSGPSPVNSPRSHRYVTTPLTVGLLILRGTYCDECAVGRNRNSGRDITPNFCIAPTKLDPTVPDIDRVARPVCFCHRFHPVIRTNLALIIIIRPVTADNQTISIFR